MYKVLVCEDDKFLSGAYRIKLTKLGFEVQLASDGDDALAHLETFTPDIILLDLIMPGKDGFSTLMRLRAEERWKHIPVIVASNLGQKEDIDKSMALGATDFIVKSDTSLEAVAEKINTILKIPPQPKPLESLPQQKTPQAQPAPQPAQPKPAPQTQPVPTQPAPQPQQPAPVSQTQPGQPTQPVPPSEVKKEENVR